MLHRRTARVRSTTDDKESRNRQRGTTLVEYACLVSFVATLSISTLTAIGAALPTTIDSASFDDGPAPDTPAGPAEGGPSTTVAPTTTTPATTTTASTTTTTPTTTTRVTTTTTTSTTTTTRASTTTKCKKKDDC